MIKIIPIGAFGEADAKMTSLSVQGSKTVQWALSERQTEPYLVRLPWMTRMLHSHWCLLWHKKALKVHLLLSPKSQFLALEKSWHADTNLWRMENHKLTEAQQYASVGKTKKFANVERADWEREDYQFYSLDSHRDLKAAHGIKMSKWTRHGTCLKWRKSSLCINTLI